MGIAKNFLPGSGLLDAFESVKIIASGKGGFWDAVNIATAAFPIAKGAAKLIGLRSLFKARVWKFKGCNCFIGGTLVDTPQGARAIEDVQVGDLVFTWPEDDVYGDRATDAECNPTVDDVGSEADRIAAYEGAEDATSAPCQGAKPHPKVGRVTRVFRNLAPAILWLTLADGTMLGTTPGHQLWTHQSGWTFAGELRPATLNQPGETLVGLDGRPVEVIAARLDPTPTVVYNLEIDGTWTYFVHGAWVHNNSCDLIRKLAGQIHHAISRKIHNALEQHPKLKGHYKYRDRRFETQAVDEAAHKGYETWHRNLDEEIADEILKHENAGWGPAQFEAYLKGRYSDPDLLNRFPNGLP